MVNGDLLRNPFTIFCTRGLEEQDANEVGEQGEQGQGGMAAAFAVFAVPTEEVEGQGKGEDAAGCEHQQ